VSGWNLKAAVVNVELPLSGTIRLVFVRWSKKQWHCFLCTETDLEPEEILNYYARRWAIEVYFRDAKQLLALGQGQSECFDALIAWTSIVMIRYLLLVYILARKQGMSGSIGPLFQELAKQHLELAVLPVLIERLRRVFMMSSILFQETSEMENLVYMLDLIDNAIGCVPINSCAKL
ncbi:MAG: transposase, partial [Methanoregulaceae archaeon]|nr:transposase [Methanoregulaceae archaeon]